MSVFHTHMVRRSIISFPKAFSAMGKTFLDVRANASCPSMNWGILSSATVVVPTSASSYHDSCCRLNPQVIASLRGQTSTPAASRPALHPTIDHLFMFKASAFRPTTCRNASFA